VPAILVENDRSKPLAIPEHRPPRGPAGGCPSAALLPEITREPLSTRRAYEEGLLSYVSTLAALLPNAGSATSCRRAMAIFGLMVGTLQFARAVADAAQAEQILKGGVQAALHLARTPPP
jgi:TetR/AcrR family transcriptional regulator, transcriptional repressor for nem operon